MRTSAERLRAGLLVGAALVLAAVSGFLLVARWRAHRLLHDLPGRLGAEIEKETNGYTYSQSLGGRTVFTIHASKATQRKDGQTLLHDVGVVLYGKTGRTNRIHGKEFTYDQKAGEVRAMGQVELDLEAPAPETAKERAAFAGGAPARPDAGGQAVHVVTSGLVYLQKLGVASTPDPIRFSFSGVTGQAVGASFNTDSGTTVLERDVRVTTMQEGRPATLTARHGELSRPTHLLQLVDARYATSGPATGQTQAGERAVTAAAMRVRLNDEGAVQEVVGSGGVDVREADSQVRSPEGTLVYAADGRPERAVMRGGVHLARTAKTGDVEGDAAEVQVNFVRGVASTVEMRGEGRLRERTARGLDQRLAAKEMLIHLSGGRMERLEASGDAVASGSGAGGAHQELRAQRLLAMFQPAKGSSVELREVTGTGGTEVHRVLNGVEETSRGESLEARFGPGSAKSNGGREGQEFGGGTLLSAVQKGDVHLLRVAQGARRAGTSGPGAPDRLTASAEELQYDGATGKEVLRGGVQMQDGESALRADTVEGDRASGDTVANGDVLLTYQQSGGTHDGEPVHVRSAHAVMHRASETAEFRGGAGGAELARVWQGGSQVEAPVVKVDRKRQLMDAMGTAAAGLPVRVVLVNEAKADGGEPRPAAGTKHGPGEQTGVTRVRSGTLHYDGVSRRAYFAGGVVVQDGDTEMRSETATAVLRAAGSKVASGGGATTATMFGGGGLESMTAVGDVLVQQPPGRKAQGAQAVYRAEDGTVVLTGTPGAPPRADDPTNGSVTGASLRFRAGDNSVMVEGRSRAGETTSGDGRVHTRTRVRPPQ